MQSDRQTDRETRRTDRQGDRDTESEHRIKFATCGTELRQNQQHAEQRHTRKDRRSKGIEQIEPHGLRLELLSK